MRCFYQLYLGEHVIKVCLLLAAFDLVALAVDCVVSGTVIQVLTCDKLLKNYFDRMCAVDGTLKSRG